MNFSVLPKNILFAIASEVSLCDLNKLCRVNKKCLRVCRDDQFWQFKILKEQPELTFRKPSHLSYKEFYVRLYDAGNLYQLCRDGKKILVSSNVSKCSVYTRSVQYIDVYSDLYENLSTDDGNLFERQPRDDDGKNIFVYPNIVDVTESIHAQAILKANGQMTIYNYEGSLDIPQIVTQLSSPCYMSGEHYHYIDKHSNLYLVKSEGPYGDTLEGPLRAAAYAAEGGG